MKPFARIGGKCANVQLSSIQYPVFDDGGEKLDIGCWLLNIGYLHIQHMLSFPSHGAGGKEKQTPQRRNPTWILPWILMW